MNAIEPNTPTPERSADEERRAYIFHINSVLNDQIKFADTKAAFLAALSSGLLGGLHTARVHEHFTVHPMGHWNLISWTALLSFLLLGLAIGTSLLSIIPRRRSHQPLGYGYWGAVAAHNSQEGYYRALQSESAASLNQHLAHTSYALATICRRKYTWITVGVLAVITGAAIGSILIVLAPAVAGRL